LYLPPLPRDFIPVTGRGPRGGGGWLSRFFGDVGDWLGNVFGGDGGDGGGFQGGHIPIVTWGGGGGGGFGGGAPGGGRGGTPTGWYGGSWGNGGGGGGGGSTSNFRAIQTNRTLPNDNSSNFIVSAGTPIFSSAQGGNFLLGSNTAGYRSWMGSVPTHTATTSFSWDILYRNPLVELSVRRSQTVSGTTNEYVATTIINATGLEGAVAGRVIGLPYLNTSWGLGLTPRGSGVFEVNMQVLFLSVGLSGNSDPASSHIHSSLSLNIDIDYGRGRSFGVSVGVKPIGTAVATATVVYIIKRGLFFQLQPALLHPSPIMFDNIY